MIRVIVEVIPHGTTAEEIATIEIMNNLTHEKRPEMGNYDVVCLGPRGQERTVQVKNHHRDHGVVPLIKMALNRLGHL